MGPNGRMWNQLPCCSLMPSNSTCNTHASRFKLLQHKDMIHEIYGQDGSATQLLQLDRRAACMPLDSSTSGQRQNILRWSGRQIVNSNILAHPCSSAEGTRRVPSQPAKPPDRCHRPRAPLRTWWYAIEPHPKPLASLLPGLQSSPRPGLKNDNGVSTVSCKVKPRPTPEAPFELPCRDAMLARTGHDLYV